MSLHNRYLAACNLRILANRNESQNFYTLELPATTNESRPGRQWPAAPLEVRLPIDSSSIDPSALPCDAVVATPPTFETWISKCWTAPLASLVIRVIGTTIAQRACGNCVLLRSFSGLNPDEVILFRHKRRCAAPRPIRNRIQ